MRGRGRESEVFQQCFGSILFCCIHVGSYVCCDHGKKGRTDIVIFLRCLQSCTDTILSLIRDKWDGWAVKRREHHSLFFSAFFCTRPTHVCPSRAISVKGDQSCSGPTLLHPIASHCITLHCIALHCIALHCTVLHSIAFTCTNRARARHIHRHTHAHRHKRHSKPPQRECIIAIIATSQNVIRSYVIFRLRIS